MKMNERMKECYENRSKTYLTKKIPVIIRLDGKAFHTFTRGFNKPYDEIFHNSMNRTMKYLCENIQGCKIGYTQSDEITLLLTDYETFTTDAWFNYSVQKICSVAASMATFAFNMFFAEEVEQWHNQQLNFFNETVLRLKLAYNRSKNHGAMFDCRCFNIPENDIVNCFIWRQKDCTRNAIQMLGQTYFPHKDLHGKSTADIKIMVDEEFNINFDDMPSVFKFGACCIKEDDDWKVDCEIPSFIDNREYIQSKLPDYAT